MKTIVIVLVISVLTSGCGHTKCANLNEQIRQIADECRPAPGMTFEDMSMLWPERFGASLRVWDEKGNGSMYHAIRLRHPGHKSDCNATVLVRYQDSKVASSTLAVPNSFSTEVHIDDEGIDMPYQPTEKELQESTLESLQILKKALEARRKEITQQAHP